MPTVPTPPTIDDGVLTSSELNQFRDAIAFLQEPPIAELRQTGAQSIPSSTATAVTFGVEDVDSDVEGTGGHSTVSNTSRFTARYPGWVELGGGVCFAANATNHRLTWWQVNGIDVNGSLIEVSAAAGGAVTAIPARPKKVYLDIGDYVELMAFQNSGGALNTSVTTTEQPSMTVKWASL